MSPLPLVAAARPAVRIYRPAKGAMQSGIARCKVWVLEFIAKKPQRPEPLMGWSGGGDSLSQVALSFKSKEEALAYAARHDLSATLVEPQVPSLKIRSYADNFRPDRIRW